MLFSSSQFIWLISGEIRHFFPRIMRRQDGKETLNVKWKTNSTDERNFFSNFLWWTVTNTCYEANIYGCWCVRVNPQLWRMAWKIHERASRRLWLFPSGRASDALDATTVYYIKVKIFRMPLRLYVMYVVCMYSRCTTFWRVFPKRTCCALTACSHLHHIRCTRHKL